MISFLVNILVFVINVLYKSRPIPRFYVLETIARVPYFAYVSVLHLYETLGFWRKADWLKVHFAESWNELHHLLIMEELGGGKHVVDSLLAKTAALIYYWVIVVMYLFNSEAAYNFTEKVEGHAFHTYDQYLKENEAELKQKPAPKVAIAYYRDGDLYMFDEFQTSQVVSHRRPPINNLYDVFVAIRDDENEHVKTMVACQKIENQGKAISPHTIATLQVTTEPQVEVVIAEVVSNAEEFVQASSL